MNDFHVILGKICGYKKGLEEEESIWHCGQNSAPKLLLGDSCGFLLGSIWIQNYYGCSLWTSGGMLFGSDIHSKRGNNLTYDCLCFEESKKQADFIETKDCKSLSAIFQHSTTKRRFHSSDISSNPDNTQMLIFSIFHPSTAISHGLSKSI